MNPFKFACAVLLALLVSTSAFAAVLPWMSLEEITAQAEVIVLGTVESAEGVWSDDGRIIVTRAAVSVERALKGGPRAKVLVETPGGRVGDQAMVASGAPVFRVGDRVVVFLEPAGAVGPGEARRHAVVGWNLGKMNVRREPRTGRDLVEDRTSGSIYLDRQGRPVGPDRAGKGPAELKQFLGEVGRLVAAGSRGGGR